MSTLDGALCVGKPLLFESTLPDDHQQAAALCDQCPVRDACQSIVPPAIEFPTGTWAGRLYVKGRRYPRKADPRREARTAKCAICGTTFAAGSSTAKYCGDYCRAVGWARQKAKNREAAA